MSSFNPVADEAAVFELRSFHEPESFKPADAGPEARDGGEAAPSAEGAPVNAADEARERAWQEGYEAAQAELQKAQAEALDPALRALARSADVLEQQRHEYLGAHRESVVELALVMAERILGEELTERPEHLMRWIEDAISQLSVIEEGRVLRLYLSPTDLEQLNERERGIAASLEWVADAQLAPGDARVENGSSAVRVGIEEGVAEVRRVLRERLDAGNERA